MQNQETTQSVFTFFGKGHYNQQQGKWVPSTRPQQTVDISWCGQYILSERAKWATNELRRLMQTKRGPTAELQRAHEQVLRDFKLKEFDAVAAAGTFSYGNANSLIHRSPYIVLDIDELSSTEEAREVQQTFIKDQDLETALCFVSPKGLGVKWWVELPDWCIGKSFAEQYAALSRHVGYNYGLQVDPTGSNVNRLCFLPYDPNCFIHSKYLKP